MHLTFVFELMSQGEDYLSAHKDANKIESYCRKHPGYIDERLKFEIEENKTINS